MKSALILAAGVGTRAWPYNGVRQKVTVPIMGEPMVRRLALSLKELGIEEIGCVIGHRGEAVRACLADLEGMRFAEQRQPKGTADAVLTGLSLLSGDEVLICYGDVVLAPDNLRRLLSDFSESGADASVLNTFNLPGATRWIGVTTTPDGMVSEMRPAWEGRTPRFAGMCAAKNETLKRYLLRNPGIMSHAPLGSMPPVEADLSHSLHIMAQDGRPVRTITARDYVVDVDKPWQIVEANVRALRHTLDALTETVLEEGAHIHDSADITPGTCLKLGRGASIGRNCRIQGPLILAPGAQVNNGAILHGYNFIGPESTCEDSCLIKVNSIIGPRCYFGHGMDFIGLAFESVSVRHSAQLCAVLGSHVNIAGGVMTGNWRFDDGVTTQRVGGCREKPERFGEMTFIGDFVRVGNNVVFSPGSKVGSYSCVGPMIYVDQDVPDRSLLIKKDVIERKDWGPERYGW